MSSCIARQPIFSRDRQVFGYELLFRPGTDNAFDGGDGDHASAKVVNDAIHVHGMNALAGHDKCFINITPKFLYDELYTTLPSDQVVLELLETIEPDDALLAAVVRCRAAGYKIALDDYVLEPKFTPLLSHIDVLKVDFMGTDAEQQNSIVQQARGRSYQLLAEKVETYDDFKSALAMGYTYFQGYFFCKPEMIRGKDVSLSGLSQLQFLQHITEPTLNLDKLDEVIRRDVALSYKLLRYLNSGAFRFRNEIKTIRHALSLIGDEPLRKWASLVLLSIAGESKPPELLNVCMIRARLCETLAEAAGMKEVASGLFMTGMFSILGAMLDHPLEALLEQISLPSVIKATLLGEATPLRPALDAVFAIENGDWDQLAAACTTLNIEQDVVGTLYVNALQWAAEQNKQIGASGPARSQAA